MVEPVSRGNKQWWGFCSRGQGCMETCDSNKSESKYLEEWNTKKYYGRGDIMKIKWLRQNHPGGFVRLAIVPFDHSDNGNLFDENVVKYVCYETNCHEDYNDDNLGYLNGPGNMECSTKLVIPNNLIDGHYTLQWTWFSGGVYFGNQKSSFANYVSCSDFTVDGGNILSDIKDEPVFQGGDAAYPFENKCRYWSTNKYYGCIKGSEQGDSCGFSDVMSGAPEGFE